MSDSIEQRASEFRTAFRRLQHEIGKVIVGHTEVVEGVLTCLFVGGHALLDRFFFKLLVGYSSRQELSAILDRTTRGEDPRPDSVMNEDIIRAHQRLVREVLVGPPVQDYAIRLVLATHPQGEFAAAATNR